MPSFCFGPALTKHLQIGCSRLCVLAHLVANPSVSTPNQHREDDMNKLIERMFGRLAGNTTLVDTIGLGVTLAFVITGK